jgi:pimeloyl-ACP methyl ester carboxylesterase
VQPGIIFWLKNLSYTLYFDAKMMLRRAPRTLSQRLRNLGKFLFLSYAGIFLFSQILSSCVRFEMDEKGLRQSFVGKKNQPHAGYLESQDRRLFYVEIGSDTLPVVIFVHGSPGSWNAFIDFMKDDSLLRQVQMVSVDRPGFGLTSGAGQGEKDLESQARYLRPLLEKYKKNKRRVLLVGHSLGGPLIARLAMDYPQLVDALVLVAPSIDPALEPREWFRAPLDWVLVRPLVPPFLRASNHEIRYLKPSLERMLPLWSGIRQPCVVIQGQKDNLVPPGNAHFAQRQLVRSEKVTVLLIDDLNHFVPWLRPDLIKTAIRQSL